MSIWVKNDEKDTYISRHIPFGDVCIPVGIPSKLRGIHPSFMDYNAANRNNLIFHSAF